MSNSLYIIIAVIAAAAAVAVFALMRSTSGSKPRRQQVVRHPRQPVKEQTKSNKGSLIKNKGPLIMIMVVLVLGAWVALAFFTPAEAPVTTTIGTEASPEPPKVVMPPSHSLSGTLNLSDDVPGGAGETTGVGQIKGGANAGDGNKGSGGLTAGAAAVVATPGSQVNPDGFKPQENTGISSAAKSTAQPKSSFSNVGSMLNGKPAKPSTQDAGKPKAAPKTEQKPKDAPEKPAAAKPAATDKPASGKPEKPKAIEAEDKTDADPSVPPKPAPKTPGNEILSGTKEFTVHLGSFRDQKNADLFRNKLAGAGSPAFISEITVNGQVWYRVMSGRFSSQSLAEAHGRELKRQGLTTDNGRYLIKPLP